MNNELLQSKINRAWSLKKEGQYNDALKLYEEVIDFMSKESADYARSFEGAVIDEGDTRKITPTYLTKAKDFLTRDNVTCTVFNNMGVIYAEQGDLESAKSCFIQSIELTPEEFDYPHPVEGLKALGEYE
jgi:tetratricopeptide (TPR) repeat protein